MLILTLYYFKTNTTNMDNRTISIVITKEHKAEIIMQIHKKANKQVSYIVMNYFV